MNLAMESLTSSSATTASPSRESLGHSRYNYRESESNEIIPILNNQTHLSLSPLSKDKGRCNGIVADCPCWNWMDYVVGHGRTSAPAADLYVLIRSILSKCVLQSGGCNAFHKLVDNLNLFREINCCLNTSFNYKGRGWDVVNFDYFEGDKGDDVIPTR